MRLEQEKYRLIDDYLKNKLSGDELLEFEQRLKIDPELFEELSEQKMVNNLIIENRFFKVVDSVEFALASAPKAPLATVVKTVIGIVSAGIAVLTGYYLLNDPGKEIQKNESSPIVITESKKEIKETKPEVSIEEEKEVYSEITPSSENLNDKELVQKPEEKKVENRNKAAKAKEQKEFSDETYLLEIPIDGNNQEVYSFNPTIGEAWIIPLYGRKTADLEVFDKAGKEVFKTKIMNGTPKYWKGIDANGSKLESGNYIFVIDFGKGNIERGHINIINKE